MEYLHDWINSGILVILGVVIFAQNGILKNMKSFMDIFDIKKVRDFVDMREETVVQKSKLLLENNEKVQKMIDDATDKNIDLAKELYFKQMGKEHDELVNFTLNILAVQNKSKRNELIENALPLTKRYIHDIFEDLDNKKT